MKLMKYLIFPFLDKKMTFLSRRIVKSPFALIVRTNYPFFVLLPLVPVLHLLLLHRNSIRNQWKPIPIPKNRKFLLLPQIRFSFVLADAKISIIQVSKKVRFISNPPPPLEKVIINKGVWRKFKNPSRRKHPMRKVLHPQAFRLFSILQAFPHPSWFFAEHFETFPAEIWPSGKFPRIATLKAREIFT